MVEIIPGISEKDWEEIERKVKLVAPYVSWVHLDIADNTMVPLTTFADFSRFKSLTKSTSRMDLSKLSFEAHLLVANPEKYIRMLVEAGFKRLMAHLEANDPRRFLDQARYEEVEVGIAIDGATDFREVEPFLEEVDLVLVMTAEAGFSEPLFLPEAVEKIKTIHRHLPDLPIEAEGGIDERTGRLAAIAGATRLVPSADLFRSPKNIAAAIESLKK